MIKKADALEVIKNGGVLVYDHNERKHFVGKNENELEHARSDVQSFTRHVRLNMVRVKTNKENCAVYKCKEFTTDDELLFDEQEQLNSPCTWEEFLHGDIEMW